MSKKSCFKGPFDKQHGHRAQGLFQSGSRHLYDIHWQLPRQLSWKRSVWLTWKILGLLVNTFPADEKYPILNRENLAIPIQIQLSDKQKVFSHFIGSFLKYSLNIGHFETKGDTHSFFIAEIADSENLVR